MNRALLIGCFSFDVRRLPLGLRRGRQLLVDLLLGRLTFISAVIFQLRHSFSALAVHCAVCNNITLLIDGPNIDQPVWSDRLDSNEVG